MQIENKFWLIWVAGNSAPKRIHPTYESALKEAERLRKEKTTREVFILEPIHRIEGRKLLSIKPRRLDTQEVEQENV